MEERTLARLQSYGITEEAATRAGWYDVPDASALFPEFKPVPALVLPYFDANEEAMTFERDGRTYEFVRIRYLEEVKTYSIVKTKPQRYTQPSASGVHAYFPPVEGLNWAAVLDDPKTPLIITEGEAKSLATTLAGFSCIGLGGVANFVNSQDGSLIPELAAANYYKRPVWIAFDSDARLNPQIQMAEARLVDELRKRGAELYLVRLPPNGDAKVGLDDFLLWQGSQALEQLLMETPALGAIDSAVVALNKSVCYVGRDGALYDLDGHYWINPTRFISGSRFSTETVRVMTTAGRNPGVKMLQVAKEWLTHPLARRYDDLIFEPGSDTTLTNESGQPALNLWNGWRAEPGDVDPFLRLNEYIFSNLPEELRDFALKLMIYKAQNPLAKVFAPVLVGNQGGGKSLWSKAIQYAFAPYSVTMDSKQFLTDFQGWMERSVLAVVNEAEPGHLEQAKEKLKTFITDVDQRMNEKYRVPRMVKCYTSFILSANDRAVGSFSYDDRRMFVVDCPPPHPDGDAFYQPIYADWMENGGPQALMSWMLNFDLEGWRPPARPPMTSEKAMANREARTPVEDLAWDTLTATDNTVVMWIDRSLEWAMRAVNGGNASLARYAQDIIDSYSSIQVRPFYTSAELSAMFPDIASALYGTKKTLKTVPGEISRQLRNAGVSFLKCADNPEGFMWGGRLQQFLVIAAREEWAQPITQADFARLMANWPRYSEYKQQRRRA